MQEIKFAKYSGTGNDFIIIDNRGGVIAPAAMAETARLLCRRRFAVGADGLILIEDSGQADFRWQFFNADGSRAEMCGNGARCAAHFAHKEKIAGARMRFETIAGLIAAEVNGDTVKVGLTPPRDIVMGQKIDLDGEEREIDSIDTGVPHAIHFVAAPEATPVKAWGRAIRYHRLFEPRGTNVNFVSLPAPGELLVRTYERGVEDETMACGTGAVASALIAAMHGHVTSPVTVSTSGGDRLVIHFRLTAANGDEERQHRVSEVSLEGPADLIYEGELRPGAMKEKA